MQPTGGGGGGIGGGELSRGGLARFRSAPATWLEALLESEEEDVVVDPPKPTTPQPLPPNSGRINPSVGHVDPELFGSTGTAFLRQNSSPAEFLSQISSSGSDAYFSNFGIPANYEYLSPSVEISGSSKRPRAIDSSQVKGEQIGNLHGGTSSASIDAEMEKLLEDSVPCRIRAKRGCATHPRSVAERVRRTRISDRIRKLQELLPNMDKQTNTADMLEEAVDYVRFLQKQIQELTEHQKNCKCATD